MCDVEAPGDLRDFDILALEREMRKNAKSRATRESSPARSATARQCHRRGIPGPPRCSCWRTAVPRSISRSVRQPGQSTLRRGLALQQGCRLHAGSTRTPQHPGPAAMPPGRVRHPAHDACLVLLTVRDARQQVRPPATGARDGQTPAVSHRWATMSTAPARIHPGLAHRLRVSHRSPRAPGMPRLAQCSTAGEWRGSIRRGSNPRIAHWCALKSPG